VGNSSCWFDRASIAVLALHIPQDRLEQLSVRSVTAIDGWPLSRKEARASAVSPQIESGNVYVPHPSLAPWIDGYLAEWAAFPRGANDDQVDATTQALNRMRDDHRPGILGFLEMELKERNPAAWEALKKQAYESETCESGSRPH